MWLKCWIEFGSQEGYRGGLPYSSLYMPIQRSKLLKFSKTRYMIVQQGNLEENTENHYFFRLRRPKKRVWAVFSILVLLLFICRWFWTIYDVFLVQDSVFYLGKCTMKTRYMPVRSQNFQNFGPCRYMPVPLYGSPPLYSKILRLRREKNWIFRGIQ